MLGAQQLAEHGRQLGATVEVLDAGEALGLVPVLKADALAGALFEPGAGDVFVIDESDRPRP